MESQTKQCQNCHDDFVIEPEDFDFYEKMKVPAPTWCPDCRLQRRLAFRNERALYKRKCDLCGKDTISRFDPEKGIVNYCGECWWSDKWDPTSYGQDYDFSKPFFEQWGELLKKVPQYNLITMHNTLVDTYFVNMNHYLKSCYYIFNSDHDERCMYGEEIEHCKDCVDVTMTDSTELAYESLNCNKCYQIYYSADCENSHDIWFSKNLSGCSNCFGCVNLRSQQYCIFNEKFSKEDYQKKIAEFKLDSHIVAEDLKKKAAEFWLNFPNKYMHGVKNLNCNGDYIFNSKYIKNSFIVTESEYCRFCMWLVIGGNKECYDFTQYGENAELVYETLCSGKDAYDIIGGINSLEGRYMKYCGYCYNNNSNIFGCISLRNKQYCILNKQYTKEEYEELVPKIIEHMKSTGEYGEFFPMELSPSAYNDSFAYEHFPLTKEEVETAGLVWHDSKEKQFDVTMSSDKMPDDISNVDESITKEIISCAHGRNCVHKCAGVFRITKQELQFYKKLGIPLPRICQNCRHYSRFAWRNPAKLWHRQCMCDKSHTHHTGKCTNEFETSYAPDRPEIVYCENCYNNEVA